MEERPHQSFENESMEKLKKAKIISGFPGVGKSTLLKSTSEKVVLDSDSSNFSWANQLKGERDPNWPNNYIDHIKNETDKADVILVSSHDVVRNALVANGIDFALVYPSLEMKEEYIQRYKDRGSNEKFILLLEANYETWIKELMSQKGCNHVVLQPGQYLSDVVDKI